MWHYGTYWELDGEKFYDQEEYETYVEKNHPEKMMELMPKPLNEMKDNDLKLYCDPASSERWVYEERSGFFVYTRCSFFNYFFPLHVPPKNIKVISFHGCFVLSGYA